ncbi:MAG TPA: YceH family protein [Thermoanaerobaculia bacterium]|nr:YceH family protein [Thermoanaerobaculia bacterium]
MTYIHDLDTSRPQRPRIPRTLDSVEVRVLGSLMEKQLATPEYYPLTLNALVAAANQKSNREPVMELSEQDIARALERLQDEKLVWKVMGGRAVRYDHNLDTVWHLNRSEKALLTLLFLRGPQTAGELRGRSDRLQQFDSIAQVEETLREMTAHSEPLVRQLPRRPGQKEERWATTVAGEIVESAVTDTPAAAHASSGEPLSARVAKLETRVEDLERLLAELRAKLGE